MKKMEFLKLYEEFDLFNKKKKKRDISNMISDKSTEEVFSYVKDNYKSLIDNTDIFFSVSLNYLAFGTNMIGLKDREGYFVFKYNNSVDSEEEITKETFDKYKKILIEAEDYFNTKDDEKKQSSMPGIDSEGNMVNVKENNLDEYLEDFLGKSFSYECYIVRWTSESENTRYADTVKFTNTGFNAGSRGDESVYIEVFADCS